MPITQILLTAAASGGGGSTTPDGNLYINDIPSAWGSVGVQPNNKPFYNSNFSFPDGVTTGATWDFNGSNQFMTTGLISGFTQLYANIWFFPTANGRVLMTTQGQLAENEGFHHTALEINLNGTVSGRFWSNGYMTTDNAVNLNQWNHIYFRHTGSEGLIQLNGGTATTATNSWTRPDPLVLGFGTTSITNNGISARFMGSIADVDLYPTNTASNYEATRSKYETPPLPADFTIEWWQKMENNSNNARAWAVGLYPVQKIALSYEGGINDYFWINDSFIGTVARDHRGQGWQHMAMVRHNGVVKGYENGQNYFTTVNTSAITATDVPLYVGTGETAAGTFKGYIKDLHIIKGYAKYTGNFTPPAVPIIPYAGSQLLLNVNSDENKFTDNINSTASTMTGTVIYSSDTPYIAAGPYTQYTNQFGQGGGVFTITFADENYNADLLNVRPGWTVSVGGNAVATVSGLPFTGSGTTLYVPVNVDLSGYGFGTFTFTQPNVGGSLYFNGTSYLNYGASANWAMDV